MPKGLVLDTSAALALLRDDPAAAAVLDHLKAQIVGGGEVSVPSHFWLEIANALARQYRHTPEEVLERVRVLDELAIATIELDRPLWLLALVRMARYELSSSDATYLALAEALDARLLTLDASLAAAAGSRAVVFGSRRLSEAPASYSNHEPGQMLALFGDYLALLRHEAIDG